MRRRLDLLRAMAFGCWTVACASVGDTVEPVGGAGGEGPSPTSGGGKTTDDCPLGDGGPVRIVDISAGADHMLALDSCGQVYCWGIDDNHACGTAGAAIYVTTPTRLTEQRELISVSADSSSSFVLRFDGAVLGWGDESVAELGDGPGSPADPRQAATVLLPGPATSIRTWGMSSAAGLDDGSWYVWGDVWPGDGPDEFGWIATPLPVPYKPEIAAYLLVCYLDGGGAAHCAGDNRAGQVGDGTLEPRVDFVRVDTPTRFQQLVGDNLGVIGISSAREVWGWGDNGFNRLGNGGAESTDRYLTTPVRIEGVAEVDRAVSSYSATCAWNDVGNVHCWGTVADLTNHSPTPTRIPEMEPAREVVLGSLFICALKLDDTVWCRGDARFRGIASEPPEDGSATRVVFGFER